MVDGPVPGGPVVEVVLVSPVLMACVNNVIISTSNPISFEFKFE